MKKPMPPAMLNLMEKMKAKGKAAKGKHTKGKPLPKKAPKGY